ncbi:LacI family DNA-binding transcriptional regulator [Streptomyces canus]|uniref:LacI family DNA-binding transcriptional regulator n=1 Tax=Streptomyces canus TaxID=58343 RepID=UPI0032525E71
MSVTGHTSSGAHGEPSGPQRKPASIRDVAQAADDSYQTVSRVINDHPNVKEETRRRVEEAVESLGFRRNATAFALAGGVTRSVTVLTSNTVLSSTAARRPCRAWRRPPAWRATRSARESSLPGTTWTAPSPRPPRSAA